MIEFEDMKVASFEYYDGWGDEDDPKSDWSILNNGNKERNGVGVAAFSHREACEFMLYVNGDNWEFWKEIGYSDRLIELAKSAKAQGYKYLCLYS